MRKLLSLLFLVSVFGALAQTVVTGRVSDETGEPLIGVTVLEKGTNNGTVTDAEGKYSLSVQSNSAVLVFSYVGFRPVERVASSAMMDISMSSGIELGGVTVVGSRNENRTEVETPVPVDVIDLSKIPTRNGQVEINQILQYAAPSFNASKQSGSDGADHIDPASLRGLGPDQTLVLINGKRRHQSSLINVFGSRGRGNTGTDLNTIPVAAIDRIEILRDGASAQYGSDAIAGVINIVLKSSTDGVSGNVTMGAYSTANAGSFDPGTANDQGKNRLYDQDRAFDGQTIRTSLNYGVALGENGGFMNMTTEFVNKERTLRPGADFRQGYGEAALDGFNFMINSAAPLGKNTDLYAFGGRNFRNTDAYAWSRSADSERNVTSIYPDGFTPRITSSITDASASVGIKHKLENDWKLDINNTYGKNRFHYVIRNTLNASLVDASPTEFDAGGHSLSQNTTGATLSKYFGNMMAGVNFAFGTEYRTENFQIFSGDEGSYATYDVDGIVVTSPDQVVPDLGGTPRPGGSQGFPGYSPANEVDRNRTNMALYGDVEMNVTSSFLIAGALRFENYSDFGSTYNYKLASRLSVTDDLSFRGSFSTGFRAPSLAQIYYNLRFTNFVGGVPEEVLLAPNNSPVTRAFGIDQLKQETAQNTSLGFAYSLGNFSATVDGYMITVTDRIVLTDYFDASALGINVVSAQFFANGIDTKTTGVDVVLSYNSTVGANALNVSLAGNFNSISIDDIHNGDLDPGTFYGPREKYFLRAAAPTYKFSLSSGYSTKSFDFALAFTQFSEVTLLDWQIYEASADYGSFDAKRSAAEDIYEARLVTDASIAYRISQQTTFSIGGNNIFNVYPSQQDDWTDSGGYWDSVQMGSSGAYYYFRLGFKM